MMVLLQRGLLIKVNGKGYGCAADTTRRDEGNCIERLNSLLGPCLNIDGLRRRGAWSAAVRVRAGIGIDCHST